MPNEKLQALLESSDGLTEEFKTAASGLFEEAVEARVKEITELKEAEIKTMYNEQLAEQVAAVQNRVDELVDAQLEEEYASISDRLDSYLQYVVEEFINQHEQELVEAQKSFISSEFMQKIVECFEEYNIASPEKANALQEANERHEAELDEAYETISRLVEEREEACTKLAEAQRDMDLLKLVEEKNLSELQVRKLYTVMEGFDFTDNEAFMEKAGRVCDTILSEAAKVEKSSTQKFITESAVIEQPNKTQAPAKVVTRVTDADRDVDAVLRALQRGSRH